MRRKNPLWGAPRIHGELLKLGFAVAQSTVAKYMGRKRDDDPSGQSWAAFLRNHAPQTAAMDLFVVPTSAGPAQAGAAPELGPHKLHLVPQRPEQWRVGRA